jgi:hypothetical protein
MIIFDSLYKNNDTFLDKNNKTYNIMSGNRIALLRKFAQLVERLT